MKEVIAGVLITIVAGSIIIYTENQCNSCISENGRPANKSQALRSRIYK